MLRRHLFVSAALSWLLLLFPDAASSRTWTSAAGSKMEAELAGYDDGQVTLKGADGRTVTLHVRQLSEEDKAFLKRELQRNPAYQLEEVALFPIKVDGKYGFIDARGKVVVDPAYRKAEPFSDGLGLVEGEHSGFISAGGIPVIGVDKEGPGDAYRSFSDGVAPFRKASKWGLIDRSGNVVLEPRFADISRFSHGRAVVRIGSEDQWGIGKRGYIDTSGKMVVEPVYNEALDFSDGLAAVNLKGVYGEWGFIGPSGKMVIKPQFHRAYSFYDGLARAMPKEGGGFGLIDKTGEYVLSKEERTETRGGVQITTSTWYSPGDFGCGVAPVHLNGDLFLVDIDGKKITKKLPYDNVRQFVDNLAVYDDGELSGYVDTTGKIVIPARFTVANNFRNGLAMVQTEAESAYIDRRGTTVWKGPK